MKVYYDFNADAGGYVKKDAMWWYGSYREFDTEINEPRFPVRPHQTKLRHFSGKTTYSLPSNNKIIGSMMRTLKIQPTRLDARRATNPINPTEGSTQNQRHWAWVYKAEWNKVLSDSTFAEVRGGQFGYNWPLVPNANATGPRIEDLSNSIVSGPNLHRQQNRRRNQVLGSISYFKDGLAGSHDLKFGGEVFHETFFEEFFPTSYGNLAVSYTRNGAPSEVELLDPGAIEATLMTYSFFANDTWRINNRLTLTPGLRFDRFVNSLPEQSHPAGRFSATPITVRRRRRSGQLEPVRAALRRHLRPVGQRPHGAEVQLRPVLVESEQRHLDGRQSEPLAVVPPLHVDRSQQQRVLGRGRTGQRAVDPGRRRQHGRRSESREHLHARVSRPGSSASSRPTSASAPAW